MAMDDMEGGQGFPEMTDKGLTQDERTWALIGVLSPLATIVLPLPGVVTIIAPLIVYLIKRDESDFVAFHALQTMFFEIGVTCVGLILGLFVVFIGVATFGVGLCIGIPLIIAVLIGAIVYPIIIAVKAYNGEWAEFWLVGEWARNMIGR
jgi:uncharacterized Tic20 family protein